MTYDDIKFLAKTTGCRTQDLTALASQNDPFYAGLPSRKEGARWFAKLWEQFGFDFGVHLRRIHYRIVSTDPPILKPDGDPYHNTERDWKFLGTASLAARYLKYVPAEAFVDQRNPNPILYATRPDCRPEVTVAAADSVDYLPEFEWPSLLLTGFQRHQDYLVEVWVEKSTMNDVLEPLARVLGINLVTGVGEMSETATRNAVGRAMDDGRPMRILYISDFDPAGRSMPKAVARKMEFRLYQEQFDLDVVLEPICLLPEQCGQYRLPRTPIKETEQRRANFEERFGRGATELDALEALYPGELRKVVEREICRYIDPDLDRTVRVAEQAIDRKVSAISSEVLVRHAGALAEVENEFDSIRVQLEALNEKSADVLEDITRDLEAAAPVIDEDDVPRPRDSDPYKNPLFHSMRSYLEQIDRYHDWTNGTNKPRQR